MSPSPSRRGISPASKAQRLKCRDVPCVFCGRPANDPMHVTDRSIGGCDDPLCVVPGCRECHNLYDEGKLDLLPALEPRYRAELAHAVMHLGLARAYNRVTNQRAA